MEKGYIFTKDIFFWDNMKDRASWNTKMEIFMKDGSEMVKDMEKESIAIKVETYTRVGLNRTIKLMIIARLRSHLGLSTKVVF